MIIYKKYFCQTCFKENEVSIESNYCSETVDLIEDCFICCNPNTISCTTEGRRIKYFNVEKTY